MKINDITTFNIYIGLDAPSSQMQNEYRRKQVEDIQKSEMKQLRILFGVCILFVRCQTCRIIRNFEDMYLRLIIGKDITDMKSLIEPCNVGCDSPMTLLSHVSIIL